MALDYLIPRIVGSLTFITNAIVLAAAIQFYQRRASRSVLLIAVSAALGALVSVVSWMAETSSPTFWALMDLAGALDLVMWSVGLCLLFREFSEHEKHDG
jgi:glucose-6-phosphate-specific signal transduction histidine kinase